MKKKLQEELRAVMGQLKTYRDLTDPTEEQTTQYDANLDKQEQLLADIKACDEREARALALEAQSRASVNPLPAGGNPTTGNQVGRSIVIPATARRKTRHFDSPEQAFAFGQFLRASVGRSQQAQTWLQEHGYAVSRAQTEADNTQGGYIVPNEFGAILDNLIASYGIARQYCTESVMSRDTKEHPKRPLLIRFRPGSELSSMTVDTARFANISLTAKKAYLLLQASSELSEDAAIGLADEMAMLIGESAAYTEDDCLFNGDASSTYFGINGIFNKLNGISSNVSVKTFSAISTYAAVTNAMLLGVVGALPTAAAINGDPAWYVSNLGRVQMFLRLALAQGGATGAEALAGNVPTFLGYPVRVSNAIADNETSGGFVLAFGSMRKGVVFGNRREVTIVNSQEAGFLTDSEYWRATERFDINVHEPGTSSAAGALVMAKFA